MLSPDASVRCGTSAMKVWVEHEILVGYLNYGEGASTYVCQSRY